MMFLMEDLIRYAYVRHNGQKESRPNCLKRLLK